MKLSEEIKLEIKKEFEEFKHKMYDGKTLEERKKLDQFFTPPQVSIPLLENLETVKDIDILDPTSGSGNLLAAALIAGADPQRVFGNEYDATMVKLCRERIRTIPDRLEEIDKEFANSLKAKLKDFNDWQIHQGNALIPDCLTEFGPEYDNTILKELLKRRNGLKGGWMDNPERYVAKGEVYQPGLFEDFFGGN